MVIIETNIKTLELKLVVHRAGHEWSVPIARQELAACLRFLVVCGAVRIKDIAEAKLDGQMWLAIGEPNAGDVAARFGRNAITSLVSRGELPPGLQSQRELLEQTLKVVQDEIVSAFYVGTFMRGNK